MSTDKRAAMRSLAWTAHEGQRRNGGRVPYAVHVLSVGAILDDALRLSGELADDPDLALDIHLAGVGHDFYEDTDVGPDEIRSRFGDGVDSLIAGMTNRKGDSDRDDYVATMSEAPEPVRLIKLADLIDNVTSCAYGIHDLGERWVRETFRPIAIEMMGVVGRARYDQLAKTAAILRGWLEAAFLRLEANLANWSRGD